jgi:hypothetical protein
MPNKFLPIFKRAAAGVCVLLVLFMIIYLVIAFLAILGISLPIDKTRQFLRQQSLTVLLEYGAFACAFVYLLIMGIINQPFGIYNSGFAYCYGHRPEHEAYSERGTLIFEDDRLIFKPYNANSKSFMIPYVRIIHSEVTTPHWYEVEMYTLFIRYKDDADNEHVLEIALPPLTRMMAAVRQRLFSGKVETNSCTA